MSNYARQLSHNVMAAVMLISLQLLVIDTNSNLFDSTFIERLEIVLRIFVVIFAAFSFINIVSDDSICRLGNVKKHAGIQVQSCRHFFEEVNEAYTTQRCSCCREIPASSPKGRTSLGIREWACSKKHSRGRARSSCRRKGRSLTVVLVFEL